jgi:NADH-quinone oxidoreductase subunit G
MPCTAKKAEAKRDEFIQDNIQDVDIVLTTQELVRMINEAGINFKNIKPEPLDMPFGTYSGAGVIFGSSGGVAEAVIRTAYEAITKKRLDNITITETRGLNKFKALIINIDGIKIKAAIVNSLKEANSLIKRINSGKAYYDIIEVMACPGGCIGGAGQPQNSKQEIKKNRARGLYKLDESLPIRKSHENPGVKYIYKKWLKSANSENAKQIFHTIYTNKKKNIAELLNSVYK